MTTRTLLTEPQWAGVLAGAGVTLDGGLAPLDTEVTAPETAWLAAVRLFAGGAVTVDLLAARGGRGWLARAAGDGSGHVAVVRTVDTGRTDGRVGMVPGVELSRGPASGLAASVLRLVPGLRPGGPDPAVTAVPLPLVGSALAAAREEPGPTRRALLEQLDWGEVPEEIASLDRLDGDLTLTVTGPVGRVRVIRLLHGRDGWVSIGTGRQGLRYRWATDAWLRSELAWELGASLEAAR